MLKESIEIDETEKMDDQNNLPKTITELYKRAVQILLFKHNLKFKNKPIPKDFLSQSFRKSYRVTWTSLKKSQEME